MFIRTLFLALIAIVSGGCTAIYPDGTQIRILDPTNQVGAGYVTYPSGYGGYLAAPYGSSYRQPVHIPVVRFGPMIRNNIRLVYVDGEARECDVRPGVAVSCYDGPSNWGAVTGRR